MSSATYKTTELIEIHLTNGVGYDNTYYGIVNGIMYLTTGQSDFIYSSNTYKINLVKSYNMIKNGVDFLANNGGFYPANYFSFEIEDGGLSTLLLNEGINIYNSQVVCRQVINTSVYPAYYGVVTKPSSTGNKITITCGDIATTKANGLLPITVLGDYNSDVTNRKIELNTATKTNDILKYGLIFAGSSGDPANDTKSDYEANVKAYQSVVNGVGYNGSPFYTYYIDVYCELESNILLNQNYNSYADYISDLKLFELEVVAADGSTTSFMHIFTTELVSDGIVRVYVLEDSSSLESGKTIVRFAKSKVNVLYSDYDLNSELSLTGDVEYTPMINDFGSNFETGEITGTPSKNFPLVTSDGKTKASIVVPSIIHTNVNAPESDWEANSTNISIESIDQSFYAKSLQENNRIARIENSDGLNRTTGIKVLVEVDKEYLLGEDWKLGFNFTGFDSSHDSGAGVQIDVDYLDVTFKTVLNGDPNRIIDISTDSISLEDLKTIRRFEETSTTNLTSYLGLSPLLIDQNSSQLLEQVNTYVYFANVLNELQTEIKSEHIIEKLYVEIAFAVESQGNQFAYGSMDLYLDSFFFFKDDLADVVENVSISSGEGAKWSNDPKYVSGAIKDYPVTRTEIVRFILDLAGDYDVSDYLNDIFLGVADDQFFIAWDNYQKSEMTCVELINDVLQGSNYFLISNELGKLKMFNRYELANDPDPISVKRDFVGNFDGGSHNGFYSGVENIFVFNFDTLNYYSATYNKSSGMIIASSDTNYNETSSDALVSTLSSSALYNQISKPSEIESPHTRFGSVSNCAVELGLLSGVLSHNHEKFTITEDLKIGYEQPLYISDWVTFTDLNQTNDKTIYGLIYLKEVNRKTKTIKYTCVGSSVKPSASLLSEQLGGLVLSEALQGGTSISEQLT